MERSLESIGIPQPSALRTWIVRGVMVLAVAGLGIGGYAAYRATRPKPTQYETVRVARGELTANVTATGTLQASRTVQVGSEVSGRVASVFVDYNDRVTRGQILAELDPEQLDSAVQEARASVASAQAAVQLARATLAEAEQRAARAQALAGRDLASRADVESTQAAVARSRADVASANARIAQARAALERARTSRGKSVIVSPIDGIVLTRSIEPGATVAASFQAPVLFTLAEDLARMQLHVDVDEADVGRVRDGQRATFTVDAYPERRFDAVILQVRYSPRTVSNVVTYEAVLTVDNTEGLLRPGMTATAAITTDSRTGVLVVPNAALRFVPPEAPRFGGGRERRDAEQRRGPTVWVRDATGQPAARAVRQLATDGTRTEIEGEGITEGLEVIVDVAHERPPAGT